MRAVGGGLCLAFCWALAGTALAQQPDSQEAQLRQEMLAWMLPAGDEDRIDFGGWAQLLAGAEMGDQRTASFGSLGLGTRLLWSDAVCDLVELGAHLRVTQEQGRNFSAEQWASVCLMSGFPLPLFELGHHLEWGVRPAFSARPTLASEHYNREQLRLAIGMIDLALAESRLQIGMADVAFDLHFEPDATDLRTEVAGHVSMLRYHEPRRTALGRADLAVDVFAVRFGFAGDLYSVDTVEMDPVELGGIRLGETDLFLDGRVGFGWGIVSEPWDHGAAEQQTLAEVATVAGRVAFYGGTQQFRGGLAIARELWPTMQDEVLLDNRAELWGALQSRRTRLSLRGFGAHTTTVTAGRPVSRTWTGGLRVEAAYRLGGPFAIASMVEGARSFYARIDDGAPPHASWVLQAQAALTVEIDSRGAPEEPAWQGELRAGP